MSSADLRVIWSAVLLLACLGNQVSAAALDEDSKIRSTAIYDEANSVTLVFYEARRPQEYYLRGQCAGKSFDWKLRNEPEKGPPAMTYYPMDVVYSDSPDHVWVKSYYRYLGGITLMDLRTGEGVRGYAGHAHQVSPDGRHAAYYVPIAGYYTDKLMVDDLVLWPGKVRNEDLGSAAEEPASGDNVVAPSERSQRLQALTWLATTSLAFVLAEGVTRNDDDETPKFLRYYLVTDLTTPLKPGKISVRRRKITAEDLKAFPVLQGKGPQLTPPSAVDRKRMELYPSR